MKNKLLLLASALFAINAFAQVPNYIPTNGLVGYWPFTGNANDISGNNLNGTVTGASLTTDRFSNANAAYSFNGTSDYITVADNNLLDFTNQFSISVWVKIQDYSLGSNAYHRTMVSKPRNATNAGYALRSVDVSPIPLQYSGGLNDNISNVIFGSSDTLDLNVWEHVMLTYNGSTLKIYKNGQLKSSQSASLNFLNSTQPLFFGKEFNVNGIDASWFKGQLDDIGLWDRALTQDEINGIYNATGCTNPDITTGLVASYPFTGNADDVSGNNLDGTVTGATLTTDRFGNVNSAYNFNGTSDYITVADNNLLDFTNQFSFSLWVNIQDYTLGSSIYPRNMISKPRLAMTTGYAIRSVDITPIPLQYSGGLNDNISNVIFGSSDTLDLNVWEHVMLTYNGSTLKIYKNGQLKSSQSASLNFPNSTQPLFIGKEFNTSNNDARWFKGLLDDIRVYNNALTDCDIDSLYNLGNPCDGVTASITPSGTTTFCQGGSVVLNASAGASYLWSPGGATSQSITVTSGNTYTVTVIDGNGCSATSTGTTVTVNPNPTVTLSAFSALCSNAQAVTLTGGSPSGGSYTLDGNSATSIQPWLLSAGSHPVVYSYTDGNGCIGTATQSVTINAVPTVTLSGLGTNYLLSDVAVQLTGTPAGGVFTGAGVQGNMFDPAVAGLGTHSIIYMYSNGCMNADGLCTTVDLQIDIEEEDMNGNDGSFSVTPNPNSGSFSVNLNSVNPLGLTTLEIFNSIGQLVQSEQINNQSNTLRKQLELNVAKGLYTVRLTTNGNVYSEKLIIK